MAACPHLTRISWMSGTSSRWGSLSASAARTGEGGFLVSASGTGSGSGLAGREQGCGVLGTGERLCPCGARWPGQACHLLLSKVHSGSGVQGSREPGAGHPRPEGGLSGWQSGWESSTPLFLFNKNLETLRFIYILFCNTGDQTQGHGTTELHPQPSVILRQIPGTLSHL